MGAQPSSRLEGKIPSGWLPLAHSECLALTPGVRLTALCDLDPAALAAAGLRYPGVRCFADYREMLASVKPDLISIATRTPAKPEILHHAASLGIRGLYIEKPIANSIEECRKILAALSQSGAKVAYGVNRRYHTTYRRARRMIEDGMIGEVTQIVAEHGKAPLLWSHPHTMDLFLYLSGTSSFSIAQACLDDSTVNRRTALEIDSDPLVESAYFRIEREISAAIVQTGGLNIRISGSKGNLTIYADGSFIQIDRPGTTLPGYYTESICEQPDPASSATLTAMAELARSVREDSSSPTPLSVIGTGMEMLAACVYSHLEGGRRVSRGEAPEGLRVTGRTGRLYA